MADFNLRTKMVGGFAAVVVVIGAVSTVAGMRMLGAGVISQAQIKIANDLNTARHVFDDSIDDVRTTLEDASIRSCFVDNLLRPQDSPLRGEMEAIRKKADLDILVATDRGGIVIARCGGKRGDNALGIITLRQALESGRMASGVEVFSGEILRREGKGLAERARISSVPTARARSASGKVSGDGMMLMAAIPVRGHDGRIIGALYGGRLVNRDFRIVDEVKRIVYRNLSYKGRDVGATTIFLGDIRISTNVLQPDGSRAVGTSVGDEVFERVVGRGERWFGRSYGVNDWYISAYEPIRDVTGRIVGIISVGLLEEEYTDIRRRTMLTFLAIVASGIAIAVVAAVFIAGRITGPLSRLTSAARGMVEGDMDQRIEPGPADEIGRLTRVFNSMARAIRERDGQLKRQTEQMIANSDRLAIVGQLAAGVAHEINNPMGGILVYAHLLLENPAIQGEARESLDKIIVEAARCRNIVRGLLDFSRQSAPQKGAVDIGEVLAKSLSFVEEHPLFKSVAIERGISEEGLVIKADAGQLTQVFLNILVNAAEAMDGRGRLSVSAASSADGTHVEVAFSDTGCGIPPENIGRLFDPFFTTKEVGKGTGLGLAISFGIVKGHGGSIEVKSEPGNGATFTVRLPVLGLATASGV